MLWQRSFHSVSITAVSGGVYCTAVSLFNITWKVPSVLDCTINIDISISGFPFPKIPGPWWMRERLNQQFKGRTLVPPSADNEGQWRQLPHLSLCDWSPVWAHIYISVNRVFTRLFEWPCKVTNPCSTMNKYINNEIPSSRHRSLWAKKCHGWGRRTDAMGMPQKFTCF